MTALAQYDRLESSALWRVGATAQRREVMISLGSATLVISSFNNTALSHWSLPAIERLNPGDTPALYALDAAGDESLEIAEPEMIAAIEKVRGAISRTRPHPGRLRFALRAGIAVSLAAIALFWLPDALTRQAAVLLPESKAEDIGRSILVDMARLSGEPCRNPAGQAALNRLATRVFGHDAPKITVLPDMVAGTTHLPGGIMVLDRSIVETPRAPDVVAGYLLAEALRQEQQPPLARTLDEAGPLSLFRLVTTGQFGAATREAIAAARLTETAPSPDASALLPRFAAAEISSEPYGFALDISGETTLELIEADPMRGRDTEPLLRAADWAALQAICGP